MKNCTATDKLYLPVGLILIATDIEVYLQSFNWSISCSASTSESVLLVLFVDISDTKFLPWESDLLQLHMCLKSGKRILIGNWKSLSLLRNLQAPIASALRTAVCTSLKSLLELNLTLKSREQNDLRLWPKNSGYPYPAKKHVSESHLQH